MIHEARECLMHPDRPYIDTLYARGGFLGRHGDRQCAILHAPHPPNPPILRRHRGPRDEGQRNGGRCDGGCRDGKNSHRRPQNGGTVVGDAGASNILAPPAAWPSAGRGSCRMPQHGQACGALQPQAIVMYCLEYRVQQVNT